MIDFVVRESRALVDGPMLFIRFSFKFIFLKKRLGTCGALQEGIELGNILVCGKGSIFVSRNPDAFGDSSKSLPHYLISSPIPSDKELSENVQLTFLVVTKFSWNQLFKNEI